MATANDNDVAFGELASDLIGEHGRTLILSRPIRTESQTGENAGESVSAPLDPNEGLRVDGLHGAGVSALALTSSGATAGLLVEGDVLTIGGTDYTVTGGPYVVAAGEDLAEAVAITPATAGGLANGAEVTVTCSGTQTAFKGFPTTVSKQYVDAGIAKVGDFEIFVSRVALEAAGVWPIVEGDEIYFGDTVAAQLAVVLKTFPIPSGEFDAAARVIAGFR